MKKLPIILVFILVIASTASVVKAHPGRTDADGGHTDHSTGEYHYHHGYSEHGHYDMDGDGDLDCPYEFDDNTNHGLNKSNGSDHKIDTDILAIEKDAPSKDMTFGDFVGTIMECILLSIAIGMAASHLLSYIFLSISKEKGCSITIVSCIVISIVAFIWLLDFHLCCG